ncbi:RNA polymerase sigma factor (sigma-70 family) [Actinoplanes lutulentus]|uniref:RNA polymerase sigma factor n=1 Tax=Actinoplanes lutulentus TaxID=1287878 RepID=A0A327Z694_9ACTN|nr:sigma-70 family RNA polymerase sigma factor [Actinoplanes lutulentus]MBB2948866.1 RNA polymerase sigma factor (sigma-70 family) [Actinoplanes lutulentus]RAK29776.1 RNA polymerase sigma factor (sigma-70 family) [Actinoplanes lutulentus]
MRATHTDLTGLVRAAQAGDRVALEQLVAAHLPVVYTLVVNALGEHPDVDDVVQDVMVRALRQLGSLRSAESFRPWLAAIAMRQISTHQHRVNRAADQSAPLDEVSRLPDADASFEDVTHLRVDLSGQRRQVRRASRWLDPDDQALASLWWLEVAGQLSRTELADALGISVIHAGVRVQRMRAQLDIGRAIVAASDARPRCPRLTGELAGWDGVPGSRWRKRLSRHVRDCPHCQRATRDMMATDRLLPSLVLFPVPATLTAAVLAKSASDGGALAAGSMAGVFSQLAPLAAAHPVVATVAAGALAAGATVGVAELANPERPATIAAPGTAAGAAPAPVASSAPVAPSAEAGPADPSSAASAGAGLLRTGPASLESANAAGRYVTAAADLGMLTQVGPGNTVTARRQATFDVVRGLADARCYSFRVTGGRYLRHSSWRVRLDPDDTTALFRGDATFCPRPGQVTGSVTLEAANYPGWFLRHRADELWVDQSDTTAGFRDDTSFWVRPPLAE